MAVYVDDMRAPFGRMIMCHMAADTTAELLAMADQIGLSRRWLQKSGTWQEHFDVSLALRAKAVAAGAVKASGVAKSAHGLRKARAVALAEAGATPHQIAAWTGHTTLKEVTDYTAAVDRRKAVMG